MASPIALSHDDPEKKLTKAQLQSTIVTLTNQNASKDRQINKLTNDFQKALEKAQRQQGKAIAKLTRQNTYKDRQIGLKDQQIRHPRLAMPYDLGTTKELKNMVKWIGWYEEAAFEAILKSNEEATVFVEAAIEKAMYLIDNILRVYPAEDYGEFAPLKEHIPTLVNALVEICHARGAAKIHAASFFKKRHDELKTCGFELLLEKMPAQFQLEEVDIGEGNADEDEGERDKDSGVEQQGPGLERKVVNVEQGGYHVKQAKEEAKEEEDISEEEDEPPALDWADIMNAEAKTMGKQ